MVCSTFGRAGKPSSHRLYRTADIKTTEYKDPDDKTMLLELRGTGVQTVLPGSTLAGRCTRTTVATTNGERAAASSCALRVSASPITAAARACP